jgi:hypothetical protein
VTVVALGGSASTGKTTCALALGGHVVHVDDLSRRLERDGCPHFLDALEAPWRQPADSLVAGLVDWTARLHPLIVEAAASGGIVEGEGVDPRIGWVGVDVRAVYLIELDRQALWETFATRASALRFLALSEREQATVVEMNRGYGAWLRDAAVAAGEPWVWSRPWATLAARTAAAVNGGVRGPVRR